MTKIRVLCISAFLFTLCVIIPAGARAVSSKRQHSASKQEVKSERPVFTDDGEVVMVAASK